MISIHYFVRPGIGRLAQSLSFLLVIERLELARCSTARFLRAAGPLARSSLSITVDEKRKELRAVHGISEQYISAYTGV